MRTKKYNAEYSPLWRNAISYIDPLLSSSSSSFVSIWGNTFTLKANGERPDGITDIEWAGYLTEQEMLRPGVTDAQDVIFARQMNIIQQQNAIAADAAATLLIQQQALPAPITYIDPLLSASSSFVSIWGNTFTLKANGERPDGITDIEWAGYLTDQEMKRQGVTDPYDVIFARQMNIIQQQNAIAADAAATYAATQAALAPVSYPVGSLLLGENGYAGGTVFLIDYSGGLRWFKTATDFEKFGFKWADIKTVPSSVIEALEYTLGVGMRVNNATSAVNSTNPPIMNPPNAVTTTATSSGPTPEQLAGYAAAVAAQTAQNAEDAAQQQIYAEQRAAQAAVDLAAAQKAIDDARTAAELTAAQAAADAAAAAQTKADADAAQANIEMMQRDEAAWIAIQAQEAAEAKLRAEQLQAANDAAVIEAARLQQVATTAAELAVANQAAQAAANRAVLIDEAQRQADIAVTKANVLLAKGTNTNIPITKEQLTQPLSKVTTQAGMTPVYIVGALAVAGFLTWILRKKK